MICTLCGQESEHGHYCIGKDCKQWICNECHARNIMCYKCFEQECIKLDIYKVK
jgi:hypothetical protein